MIFFRTWWYIIRFITELSIALLIRWLERVLDVKE